MTQALVASTIALWLVVIVLAVVVLALVRQVGILHERVAPAGALVGRETPRVGEEAPAIEVRDWRGHAHRIGGPSGDGRSLLLLFVSPTCPVCTTLLPVIESVEQAEQARLRVVLASDGPAAEHEAFVARHGLTRRPYVLSTALGVAYQVGRLPYAVLIDAAGIVRARGLVNTREHLESLLEAEERGVGSLQEYLERRRAGGDERLGQAGEVG